MWFLPPLWFSAFPICCSRAPPPFTPRRPTPTNRTPSRECHLHAFLWLLFLLLLICCVWPFSEWTVPCRCKSSWISRRRTFPTRPRSGASASLAPGSGLALIDSWLVVPHHLCAQDTHAAARRITGERAAVLAAPRRRHCARCVHNLIGCDFAPPLMSHTAFAVPSRAGCR